MKTIKELNEDLDRLTKLLIEGLLTDGSHHKQHYLDKALRMLAGDEFTDKVKFRFQWDDGIEPFD